VIRASSESPPSLNIRRPKFASEKAEPEHFMSPTHSPEKIDPVVALQGLVARQLGPGYQAAVAFEKIPPRDGLDVCGYRAENGCLVVRGSSGPAMGYALREALPHAFDIHLSWYGSRKPEPGKPDVQRLNAITPWENTSWARWRYFLNYCSLSYSLPYWEWKEWEELIDWMILHGVNMPLSIVGLEAIWKGVFQRLGLDRDGLKRFLPGAAYLPFGWMGCLDGWGGPLSDVWIDRHAELGNRILRRQRELGMTPVMQGFTGHVPPDLLKLHPGATARRIEWVEWETWILDPMEPLFREISSVFAEEQQALFGTDHYYAADPFIEMIPPSGDEVYLAELSSSILEGLRLRDSEAVWVLQGWCFMFSSEFWTESRIRAFLDGVPSEHMVILDLYCEGKPMHPATSNFFGKNWLWCNVQNFGRNVHLCGGFDDNGRKLAALRGSGEGGNLTGIGMVNEGLCYNPAAYEFFFEQAWGRASSDLPSWASSYATSRYGIKHPAAIRAWQTLAESVYSTCYLDNSEILKAPALPVQEAGMDYTTQVLEAFDGFLEAAHDLQYSRTFAFDIVNVGKQALLDLGTKLKRDFHHRLATGNLTGAAESGREILALLSDLDELLGTHQAFLLGPWLESAKAWAVTLDESQTLEWGARRQITVWGNGRVLRDYARKAWSGLVRDFYRQRWALYLEPLEAAVRNGTTFDSDAADARVFEWELAWADNRDIHPIQTSGKPVEVARRMRGKYRDVIPPDTQYSSEGSRFFQGY